MSDYRPSLYLEARDNRKLLDAQYNFYFCSRNNLDNYKTAENLQKFLEKEDLVQLCNKELQKLRKHASKIGVKETRAIYRNLHNIEESIN